MLLLLVVLGLNPTLPPTSSPSSTCAVNALPNSSNIDADTEIPQGQATTWQCHTGFETDNLEHEGTYEAYCLGDGAALSAGGVCTEILCAVNGLTNAAAPQSVSFNAAATWTCNIGHQNTSGIGGGAYRSGQCGEDGDSLIAALGETCTAVSMPPCPPAHPIAESTEFGGCGWSLTLCNLISVPAPVHLPYCRAP